ncbi:helix-turn-helix domain-containing protein [Polymorphobacter sp.]|uniref:AraC family transcriptional regulator n=1 Tax=Polymorphobacter sp. TaxID=1909290 RepID=UPI003F70FBBA
MDPRLAVTDASADARLAEIDTMIAGLGVIADRLGSRNTVAQYEADFGDPARTRAGTSLAGSEGPLPRLLSVRDIVRISFNILDLVPWAVIAQRLARNTRIPADDNMTACLPYAPTLLDALELAVRHGEATLPWWRWRLEPDGEELRIAYYPAAPLGRLERLSTELTLVSTHRVVEMFIGSRVAAARVNFAVQPVSDPAALAGQLGCPVSIGGPASYMAIPQTWLGQPSPYHDAALWHEGVARCEADIRLLQDVPLVGRIRTYVRGRIEQGRVATLEETARALAMSARSLVRALERAGTTHHQIVDTERRIIARSLLSRSMLPLAEVAERLGFPDQSSLGRKCRQWFGDSPARLRRQWR